MFFSPPEIYLLFRSGQMCDSYLKIGRTTKLMNPACPPAILVVFLSHISETGNPFVISWSPYWKNSWKSKSHHYVLTSKSLSEVLMSHAWSITFDKSYLLFSTVLASEVSISLSLFSVSLMLNLSRCCWKSYLSCFIYAISVKRIDSIILFLITEVCFGVK